MNCREYSDIVKFAVNWDTKRFGVLTLKGSGMPILFTEHGNYGGILWDTYYFFYFSDWNWKDVTVRDFIFQRHKGFILDTYKSVILLR